MEETPMKIQQDLDGRRSMMNKIVAMAKTSIVRMTTMSKVMMTTTNAVTMATRMI